MTISIIIPTINRETDLIKTLQSIEVNTITPLEVLIIDQGNLNPETLNKFDLNLTIVKISKKSLTQAENIGVNIVRGDIISILDDDVVLDKNYFKEILESFAKYEQVKIVQGKIINFKSNRLLDFFWGLFLGPGSLRKNNYVRLLNFENVIYKSYSKSEEFCMWASGCNMNVRKQVFNYEKFDSQLIRYSSGEDVDFSFRAYKRFGANSILFQPKAKLIHNVAPTGRLSRYDRMLTRRVHKIYFVYKNIGAKKDKWQVIKQTWYIFGCFLFNVLKIFKRDYKSLFYFFAIEYQIWLHRWDIKNLDVEWMNLKLFNEKSVPRTKIVEKIKISKNNNYEQKNILL